MLYSNSKSNTILDKNKILEILEIHNINVIDLTTLFNDYNKKQINSFYPKDEGHIHFNEKGYKKISDYIFEKI